MEKRRSIRMILNIRKRTRRKKRITKRRKKDQCIKMLSTILTSLDKLPTNSEYSPDHLLRTSTFLPLDSNS